jgi:hypothetical protein
MDEFDLPGYLWVRIPWMNYRQMLANPESLVSSIEILIPADGLPFPECGDVLRLPHAEPPVLPAGNDDGRWN